MRWFKSRSRQGTSRLKPCIHLYTQSLNEERMLPFFFRHYDPFIERYVFYDDNSSDATFEILHRHPRVEIRRFERTAPDSFILSTQTLQNRVWKESRGVADWVIITAVDEHLYHPDFSNYLTRAKQKGVTAIPGLGYEMVSYEFPTPDVHLATAIRYGMPSAGYSKLSLFDPNAIEETNFNPGRHKAKPRGCVRYDSRDELLILHFKWLGADYVRRRTQLLKQGLGTVDREHRWGIHYDASALQIEERLQELHAASFDVLDPSVDHHSWYISKRWWRTAKWRRSS
jgi:hypothetical protein